MYFCPLSGAELRKSKRGKYFTNPSKKEIARLFALVGNAKTMEDVKKKIGQPDEVSQDAGLAITQYIYILICQM